MEDSNTALLHWDFHDLLFHTQSRLGRQDSAYGGTYRFKGTIKEPPLRPTRPPGQVIALKAPDYEGLRRKDASFSTVMESRRSVRTFGDTPLCLDTLSEFLFRVARVQKVISTPDGEALTFRPTPNGGAIHELELFPVVHQCDGIEAGIYWYDPFDHSLLRIRQMNSDAGCLLELAKNTLKIKSWPPILFVVTARFQRVQWKYESMAYSLILKNLGALYQTMYLAASAMRLSGCALGGGNSDLFERAVQIDYVQESSVGEFVLGPPADVVRV
jgi:SagB-type dehydrogenase family enzyme